MLLSITGRALEDDPACSRRSVTPSTYGLRLPTSQLPVSTLIKPRPDGGGRAFLAWATEAGVEQWLPPGAEQDARWAEVYWPTAWLHLREFDLEG